MSYQKISMLFLIGLALSGCEFSETSDNAQKPDEQHQLPLPETQQTSTPKAASKTLSLSQPVHKTKVPEKALKPAPDFSQFPAGSARKKAFFDYMTPLIQLANRQVMQDRKRLLQITNHFKIGPKDQQWLAQLAERYDLAPFDPTNHNDQKKLEKRVDIIPVALALAQAANESAWGTSRFARKANNYFGQWCFTEGCGLVPKRRTAGSSHEVRAFEHPFYSIKSYIKNLNTHRTYQKLRQIRYQARQNNKPPSAIAMTKGLVNYSARKEVYVKALQKMIRYNNLTRFPNLKSSSQSS